MNKRLRSILLLILIIIIALLFIKKCYNNNYIHRKQGELKNQSCYFVPISATLIVSLNTAEILKEIDFSSLRKSKEYVQKLKAGYDDNPPFTLVFADPVSAGIDVSKKATFYLDVGKKAEEVYTATLLNIVDVNKFTATILKGNLKIDNSKFYQISKINPESAVAWNDSIAIFLTTSPSFAKDKLLKQIFNPNSPKYFDHASDYLIFFESSKKDMSFWLDLNSYAENQIHATGKPGEFDKNLLRGNIISGNINFNEGSIDSDIHFKLNAILSKLLSGVFTNEGDRTITKYIPDGKPSFIASLSLNIDGLFNLMLQDVDRKVEARNSLVNYGLMLDDFGKALTGDILLTGFPNDTTTKNSVLFGMKIKDKKHFFKLISIMEEVGRIEMVENGMYKMFTGVTPFFPLLATYQDKLQRMILKDDYVFVSLDSLLIDKMQHPTSNVQDSSSYLLPLNKQHNYISFFGNRNFSSISKYSNKFSIQDYSMNYDGDQLTLHLNLLDSQKSSLKQLLSLQ